MAAVITHSVSAGGVVDPTAAVDGAAWDANHVITGVLTPAQGGTGVINNDASTITISGSFGLTFTISAATSVTFPTTGTLATLAGVETLSNKTLVAPALGTPVSGVMTNVTGLPISTGLSGAGTGVLTALGVNVGSAGAFVTFNGALGTPSSGTLTNATGLPLSTGISGAGTGVLAALAVNVGSAGAPVLFNGAGGTPSSLSLTNATGLPLSGHVSQAAYTLVANNSGSSAAPTAVDIAALTTKASPTGSDWLLLSDQAASGAFKKVAFPTGAAGTVTSVVGNGVTITSTGTIPPPYGLVNHSLAISAAGSALTISLKDASGSDPSATSPVNGYFRNVTPATGSWTQLSVTGALSLVISSGSTMGVTSSTAFRIWVVLFDDGGTARLGAINCADATHIYPLLSGKVASSTAEGGAGAADSAGVFYTGTAVTSKSYHVVGYAEWSSSGLTAGTWTTTNLLYVQSFGHGVPLPGATIQNIMSGGIVASVTTNTTTTPADVASSSVSITPTSAANAVRFFYSGEAIAQAAGAGNNSRAGVQILRGATTISGPSRTGVVSGGGTNQQTNGSASHMGYDRPNSASSTTYKAQVYQVDAGSGIASFSNFTYALDEVMC